MTGTYSCEVSTEGTFETVKKTAKMNVIGKQVTTWLFIGFVTELLFDGCGVRTVYYIIFRVLDILVEEFVKLWIFELVGQTK